LPLVCVKCVGTSIRLWTTSVFGLPVCFCLVVTLNCAFADYYFFFFLPPSALKTVLWVFLVFFFAFSGLETNSRLEIGVYQCIGHKLYNERSDFAWKMPQTCGSQ